MLINAQTLRFVILDHSSIGNKSTRLMCQRLASSSSLTVSVDESSNSIITKIPTPKVKAKFYIPKDERKVTDCIYGKIDNIYDYRLKRRRRIDPTRELNYAPEHWELHKSVYRRLRHMFTLFGSSPFQRLLFPDFFVTSMVAGGLTYYNEAVATDVASQIWMDSSGIAAGTTAIALMTAFRLNASYGRYNEGRKYLSTVNGASRDLAANSLMWLTSQKAKERMLKLIKAFSVTLAFHLNKKGGHHELRRNNPKFEEQVYAEYHAEMKDIFRSEEDEDFIRVCKWFLNKENIPLGITTLMRNVISKNTEGETTYNRELELHVQKLILSLGGCERIQKTPIPTCFTRHTSRLLCVWSSLLPFALYPACGPFFTLPSTIAISYSIMGIEDIGVQLEEPFNILPIRQYADGVYQGVDFIEAASSTDNVDIKNE